MSIQLAVRVNDEELAVLDSEVASGRAASRSDAIRQSIANLQRHQRYRAEEAILAELSDRHEQPYPDLAPLLGLVRPEID